SQPKSKLMRKLFHLYLLWFVSRIGYWLSGNKGAYHYLAESASRFYTVDEVREMLLNAGFHHVSFRPLFFGTVCIHVAVK
ncbi:class I SAM-dependent methyltransferase, partial [Chloroflexota bacterium]